MRGFLRCQHRLFLEVAHVTEGNKTKTKKHPTKPTSCSATLTQGKTYFQITELVIRLILGTHEKHIKQIPKSFSRTSLKRTPQCPVSCLHLSPISAALSEDKTKAPCPFSHPSKISEEEQVWQCPSLWRWPAQYWNTCLKSMWSKQITTISFPYHQPSLHHPCKETKQMDAQTLQTYLHKLIKPRL